MHPATAAIASGGIIFTMLRRIGLMPEGAIAPGRAIALLIAVTWLPLAVLCAVDGTLTGGVVVPFLKDPAVHARLLLAVPLLVVAEPVVSAMARRMLAELWDRQLLAEEDRPALEAAVARLVRSRDSRVAELVILVGLAVMLWAARHSLIADRLTASSSWLGTHGELTRAGAWYFSVSLYVGMVLSLRWAWWIVAWTRFLAGFVRTRVRLLPGHPDGYAGLAFLTTVQGSLSLVLASLAVTVSGRLAEQLLHGGVVIRDAAVPAAIIVTLGLLVMFGPLLLFSRRVGQAKRRTLLGYDRLGEELVSEFERRWISGRAGGEPLLGGPDPSTLIDFAGSYEEVRKTRSVPLDPRRMGPAVVPLVLPFLPLVLMVMPAKELLQRIVKLLL